MKAPPHTARQRRIVFALIDSGMGHLSPALAVKQHLERAAPGCFDITLVDLLDELGLKRLDRFVKRGWSEVLLRRPWLLFVAYWVGHALVGVLRPVISWIATPQLHLLERYCRDVRPDLLVSTHFLSTNFLAILRQRGRIHVPVVGMVVDPFETYRVAGHPGLDGLVTFSVRSWATYRRRLAAVEVARFGFPLSAPFAARTASREEARRALGIPAGAFVLLMTAGAEGSGNFHRFFQRIVEASIAMHVILVCGRNVRLRHALQEWAGRRASAAGTATTWTILGLVGNMAELIASCDVFLGAGGANLTLEALSVGRPMILTFRAPNIRGTVDYVVRNGFGWHCTRVGRFLPLMRMLLVEPGLLREAERRIAAAGIRSGTPELAAFLLKLLGENTIEGRFAPLP
jgi:processive 1,2-diacylglycerol beta-glucosyltransferase